LFAIEIIKSYKVMIQEKEYILSKQLLRSGTSVGANVSEAVHGQSLKDFISKLSIARKEANETLYWLNLLEATQMMQTGLSQPLIVKCEELMRILTSIIKTSQNNLK